MKYMLIKYKIIIASLTIVIMLFSSFYIFMQTAPSKSDEIIIYNTENSVFNGYKAKDIAKELAHAAGEGSIISEYTETHHTTTQYRYKTTYNGTIDIFLNRDHFFYIPGAPIKLYSKINPGINISDNPLKAGDIVLGIWKRFLDSLNVQLYENDYDISVKSHGTWGWKVIIRQTCNDNIPLIGTGIVAHIIKESSKINSLSIYEWSNIKIERPILTSFENAIDIICNETPGISNRSMLNFTGYRYISENVHYYFKYEAPVDNETDTTAILSTVSSYTVDENGTVIDKYTYEQWIGYSLYVNVESGEFKFKEYGISKILDNN